MSPDDQWYAASPDDQWYAAFADKAHELVPGWNFLIDLTTEQEQQCEAHADSVAPRPEAERRNHDS
jgi:hypothetical protein